MCGIAGIVSNRLDFNQKTDVKKMLFKIKHRGPDDLNISSSLNFCGGYVRLAINDIKGGNQPFVINNNNIIVYYNGEIYNYKIIKNYLKKKGYTFNSNCDGEILPYMYKEFGNNFFKFIEGMFSISLWDKSKKKLILARDFSGEKPIYYSHNKKFGLLYASEIKGITVNKNTNLKINLESIWDIPSFLWVPEPNTIYSSIKSLMPAQYLVYSNKKIKFYNYTFDNSFIKKKNNFSKKNFKKFTSNIIESRSLSDAKIGTFLSGGLDSSIVNMVLSKQNKFKAYTISFPKIKDIYDKNAYVDEFSQASDFAKKLKIKCVKIKLNSKQILNEFINISKKADQPHAISSAIGISIVSKRARKDGVKVLISGDGADEIFAGYTWYSYFKKIFNLRKNFKKKINKDISFQSKNLDIKNIINEISHYSKNKLMHALHYYGTEEEKSKIFSFYIKKNKKNSLRHFNKFNKLSKINLIKHDRNFYLTNEMLNKFDRHTMLNSVEGRSPFTSPYIKKIINKYKFDELLVNNQLKYLLKSSYRRELGKDIIERKKHGFNFPIDYCLKNNWKNELKKTFSNNSCLVKNKIVRKDALKEIYKMLYDKNKNHGHTILSFISLKYWLENNPWKL